MDMNAKILIVEDSKTDRMMIKNILEEYYLLFANDGVEAMEILETEKSFDLMILDLNMPRMNGFEVLKRVRENTSYDAMMIMIVTNYDEPENEITGIELGAVDYITKPFIASIVKTRVNAHLKLKMQRDLLEKQKSELAIMNDELESFAYSVSHDLKTPLSLIKMYSEFLLKSIQKNEDEQQLEDIQAVIAVSNQMSHLIDDILQLSKVGRENLELQNVNMSELIEKIIQNLFHLQPDRVVKIICMPNVIARADYRLMEILMFNLIQNAWKYTSKNATAQIEFGCTNVNGQTVYYVKDNGAGFDMKKASSLFIKIGRLHQASEFEGTGVGLTIVNRIIKKHNGTIWAESEVGKGSGFYFTVDGNEKASQ